MFSQIKRLLCIAILLIAHHVTSYAAWHIDPSPIECRDDFTALCMDLWTVMDLVRAINSDPAIERKVLTELQKGFVALHTAVPHIQLATRGCQEDQWDVDVYELVAELRVTLKKVFKDKKSPAYKKAVRLLSKLLEALETPIHIDAQVPA